MTALSTGTARDLASRPPWRLLPRVGALILLLCVAGCDAANFIRYGDAGKMGNMREKKVYIQFFDKPDSIDVRADCHWCGASGNESISKLRKEPQ